MFQRLKLNSLKKKAEKLHALRDQGKAVDVKNEIAVQLELAKLYDRHLYDKKYPHADIYALECYRLAASLGDVGAQYICGNRLFEKAQFWENWSKGMYSAAIHKKYAEAYYEEAFTYLQAAEANGHPFAKRLHGLALIRGFGVEKDLSAGFKLVVESIDQENAWGKVTTIFQRLGLNSPEFYAMLMNQRPDKKIAQ